MSSSASRLAGDTRRPSPLLSRRALLTAASPLAVAPLLGALPGIAWGAPADLGRRRASAREGTLPPVPDGKRGEFAFLDGEWRIAHRMRKTPTSAEWLEFAGEATCWTILDGAGSVEDLRIPTRGFRGMGLRLLDIGAKRWSDYWVNAASGVLAAPGTVGGFAKGVGTFISEEVEDGRTVWARGVWDEITPRSCRWRQGLSHDRGTTWTDTWIMHWTRIGAAPSPSR